MHLSTLIQLTVNGTAVALATACLMVPGLGILAAPAVVFGAMGFGMHVRDALAEHDHPPLPPPAEEAD